MNYKAGVKMTPQEKNQPYYGLKSDPKVALQNFVCSSQPVIQEKSLTLQFLVMKDISHFE